MNFKMLLGLLFFCIISFTDFSDFLHIVFSIEENTWLRILMGFYSGMLYASGFIDMQAGEGK